jgi:hypothetical protein
VKIQSIRPEFVVSFPSAMEDGVLYISEEFETAGHKCCCGCGEKVVTPLNAAKWRLTKCADGTVSLSPSIGNWKFTCQSHYWIWENRVIAAGMMSKQKIEAVKIRDKLDNQRYINETNEAMQAKSAPSQLSTQHEGKTGFISKVAEKLRRWWKGS